MAFIDRMIQEAPSVLSKNATAPLSLIAAVGLSVLLFSKAAHGYLNDVRTWALVLSVFVSWMLLIPYNIVWSAVDDGPKRRPLWAIIPNYAVLLIWPVLAYRLTRRMAAARISVRVYIGCNVPGWLLTWFITTIYISHDWI